MLDCDPLLRISESKVNNMVRKDIKRFKLSQPSYKLFHDFVLSENRLNVRRKLADCLLTAAYLANCSS